MPQITDEPSAVAHLLAMTGAVNGDDAAVVRVHGGSLCTSVDTTTAGVHAPLTTGPHALGRRAAARALSDLAAMGAAPLAVTCAVLVPDQAGAPRWHDAVAAAEGVAALARERGCELVGGDLSRMPGAAMSVVVSVHGTRTGGASEFITRAGARVGDELCVTGRLGAAGAALRAGADELPEPPDRLRVGSVLAATGVHAMIDVSDGLLREAALLASASRVAIDIELDLLPLAQAATDPVHAATDGDDYELLCSVPPDRVGDVRAALARLGVDVTRVGRVHAATRAGQVRPLLHGAEITVHRTGHHHA